jgi:hypothetical protein
VVTLRTDALREDGLMIASQEKNEQPVFVPLQPFVLELVRKLPPKEQRLLLLDRHIDHQDRGE